MALNGSFLSEDQFTCSICLDVFTNPSSTPCGHSFCMSCITRYWDGLKVYQCPLCKKTFQKRPDLQINRTLREITDQFKSMNGGGVVGKDKKRVKFGRGARSGHLIGELKKKLPKPLPKESAKLTMEAHCQGDSSLPLLASVTAPMASSVPITPVVGSLNNTCAHPPPVHPRPRSSGRRRFTLSGAASSQHVPLCETHLRGLMLYCRSDQVCICPDCEIEDHNDHDTVSVETEWMETKTQLRNSEEEIQEMIRERTRKLEEIKMSLTEVEMAVERETLGSVRLFSTLVSAIERSQAELMEVMEISRRAAQNHADAMIRQLEREIEDLKQRETALAELSESDDHVLCVKTFPGLSRPPVTKDWTSVSLNADLGTASVYRSLSAMLEKFQEELKNVVETGFPATVLETCAVQIQPSKCVNLL
uniref:RING-type domain-containing protein n=1 Tax=Kryptolebias marmoratus TaxID=37003 RepID=A0A3Q2ZI46_KRYMA